MTKQLLFKIFLLITLLTSAAGCTFGQAVPPAPPVVSATNSTTSSAATAVPSSAPAATGTPAAAAPAASAPPSASLVSLLAGSANLPPQVISYTPALGEEARPDAAIEVRFDQPMDSASVQAAWTITAPDGSPLSGQLSWPAPDHLRFTPAQPLQPAGSYTVTLGEKAASQKGVALGQPFTFRVNTPTPLAVSQVFPPDGAADVDAASRITVMFNRPVVALGIKEDQANLRQPLTLDPPTSGTGEWLNTSVYVFQPASTLKTNTTYTASLAAGLKDAAGDPATALAQAFSWKFTTRAGRLWQIESDGQIFDPLQQTSGDNFSLIPKITLRFLQPMQPAGSNAAISLDDGSGNLIAMRFQWAGDGQSVQVAPLKVLAAGSRFVLKVSANAPTRDGGQLGSALEWPFFTIPRPAVTAVEPIEGSTDSVSQQFAIHFASPMNPQSIPSRVTFTPPLKDRNNFYYNDQDRIAYFYSLEPSTTYEVRLLPGMTDRFGNAMNEGQTIHFTTGPLASWVYFQMPYISVFRTSGTQELNFYTTNIQEANLKLYRVSLKDFIQYTENAKGIGPEQYTPALADRIAEYTVRVDAGLNKSVNQAFKLQDKEGKPLPPGFYFLTLDSPQVKHPSIYADQRFLAVTVAQLTFKNSANDALVWATDPLSGKPIAGMALKLYDTNTNLLGQGTTGPDGLLHVDISPSTGPNQGIPTRMVLNDDPQTFAYADSNWDSGVYPENFGISSSYYPANTNTLAYTYTDRPLYRPGQPVYFKGILRTDNDLAYSLPKQTQVEVVIKNFQQEVYRQTLSLSGFGSFNGQFKLDPEAALGSYSLEVYLPGQSTPPSASKVQPPMNQVSPLGAVSFTVAEYRKPEFQIDVSAAPANLLAGQTISANVSAAYYSGGGLKNAQVSWTLRADPFYFQPPSDYADYSFYDDSRDSGLLGPRQSGGSKIVAEGKAVSDENGKLSFNLPANVQATTGSQRLTLEVSVTDFAGNTVSGQAYVTAHRSAVYVGARPAQYVGTAGQLQTFQLVALDWDGKPLAKQRLAVEISERQWFSVQTLDAQGVLRWESSVKDIPVTKIPAVETDDKGLAAVQFTPAKGGNYRAVVTTSDKSNNLARSAAYLWVAGPEFIPWRQTNDRTFQLVADKNAYKPGDVAEILIASPFQGSTYALLTLERGKVRHQEVLQLTSNSTLYRLPVTPDLAPVIYLSVEVIKGVDSTNPRPDFKIGMARINVSTEQQALKVEVTPDHKDAGPGEQVNFSVKTSAASGKPVPAEVSLGLSDLATLSLMDPNSAPILNYFYSERYLAVRTAITIVASMDEFNASLKAGQASGARGGSGGGKGGEGAIGVPEVRQNFPDTAFWQADLVTGPDGQGQVSVTLPDNLTTWRMDARGITTDTLAGQSTVDLVSSRPLLVRPQTPRFFIGGDQVTIGAGVQNNTGKDLSVDVSLQAQGLNVAADSLKQTVALKAGGQAFVTWQASVPDDATRADLVFSARGGEYSDASRPTLGTLDNQGIPVYRYEAPETVGTAGELGAAGARTEAVRLPEAFKVTQGDLTVRLEPSLAAGMTAGLTYLEQYPYECTEQTISRFLPNILTTRALQAAGISDPKLVENLKEQVGTGLQRLYSRQNSDGGWGWWNGNSDDLTSAYVVLGLVEAKNADYTIAQTVLDKGIEFLRLRLSALSSSKDLSTTRNRQAFVLYVLTRAGDRSVAEAVKLYDRREWLDLYARALLATTLHTFDPKDPRLDTLRSDLVSSAVLSATGAHWQEKTSDYWNWNTDTRSTAMILAALTVIDPNNPITANAVRWLMSARTDGRWHSTQETAWTLMALTDWMVQSGELKADYNYAVALNGKQIGDGKVNADNLRTPQTLTVALKDLLAGEANRLVLARDGQSGALYYTTHLTAYLPVPQVKALDQGLILSRAYYALNNLKTPVTQAAPGQILQVVLTIVAPRDLGYVLVNDPLPAGLEALDTSLKSSPTNQIPPDFDWQRVGQDGWGWWYFTHAELRDEKLVLSTDTLPAGTYTYTYQVRAVTSGTFQVIPPTGQEFYFPEVYGRGDGSVFTVK